MKSLDLVVLMESKPEHKHTARVLMRGFVRNFGTVWFAFVSFLIDAHQMEAASLKCRFERVFALKKLQIKVVLMFRNFSTPHKKNFALAYPKQDL